LRSAVHPIQVRSITLTAEAKLGIESHHHILDCIYDDDRCRIRTGFGSENLTCLRRFAIGIHRCLPRFASQICSILEVMRLLIHNLRLIFNYCA